MCWQMRILMLLKAANFALSDQNIHCTLLSVQIIQPRTGDDFKDKMTDEFKTLLTEAIRGNLK
jgi:hypothetical protein